MRLAAAGLNRELMSDITLELTGRYLEMIEGQYMDVTFEDSGDVTVAQYLDMIGRKTGALIESAMFMGALVATSDHVQAEAFGACGRRLGLAFQIRDDYLGVWGDPAFTGKAVGAGGGTRPPYGWSMRHDLFAKRVTPGSWAWSQRRPQSLTQAKSVLALE